MEPILGIAKWQTPASHYPRRSVGSASISASSYPRGYYRMEGVDGYALVNVLKPIVVTCLDLSGETVMIDDPLHWLGMQGLARASKGKVLVVGLGLGLVLHALVGNPKVKEVQVIDNNADVIKLISPLVPQFPLDCADFWTYPCFDFDTIILDIWWGRGSAHIGAQIKAALDLVRLKAPNTRAYVWGVRDEKLNPALQITEEVKRFWEMEAV